MSGLKFTATRRAVLQLLLEHGPATARELAARLGRGARGMRSTVLRMRGKMIHVVDWRRGQDNDFSPWVAVYAAGKKADKPMPSRRPRKPRPRAHPTPAEHEAQIVALLNEHGALTSRALVTLTGRSQWSVRRMLLIMRTAKPKRAFISGWQRQYRTSGRCAPLWSAGNKPDVPELSAEPRHMVRKRYDERARASKNDTINPSALWRGLTKE